MSALRFGYGTNGFANHRLDDALAVIADLGYSGVALTLDHAHLDPFADDVAAQTRRVAARLSELGLGVVVETGARFLLDPWRKHQPTLLSDESGPRVDFLRRAAEIAADLGAECVSFWSGVAPSQLDDGTAWRRLLDGVAAVLDGTEGTRMRFALEPEPGHYVQHLDQALRLRKELGNPERLGITLDVGHCVAVEPVSAAECVRKAGDLLFNVQLDDMRPGVHEHLEFGEGELDLAETLGALAEVGYTGLASVELPRHSHAAPDVARRAKAALTAAEWVVDAEAAVRTDPTRIRTLFPAVGRKVGRGPVRPKVDADGFVYGTVDDRARGRLLAALASALDVDPLVEEVEQLYRYGDGAERRGVLRNLHLLPTDDARVVELGVRLVTDALRANDTGLVAAALGPFAADELDDHNWRHGVLKCLFTGVPTAAVAGLARRCDAELQRMVGDYVAERKAAGRTVPADAEAILALGPVTREEEAAR
ncbi:EboA domain-containing protein [Saccharomonospora viridis]|uniref:Sugar phosphate isomerase/epimerase n=2 Tax=Saccharomonospora viridis TaxID=1852 RepID=C7MZ46_SACVD|nr:EboA domain-containing protein [Saccharomonospora viridis]ACU96167.1 sugar phosphate isomerase/epimerase [Saccharomonospora viridis DSM 43017]KHF45328.1 sugar phosphate isomerase [Saccharomonospora viridis]SFP79183.1 Sugar phosphate isomerase/epimerase [Saccharomonospora viridis]